MNLIAGTIVIGALIAGLWWCRYRWPAWFADTKDDPDEQAWRGW